MSDRVTLADLDGLSVRDAARLPHPIDLCRWRDAALYRIDVDLGVFRLTEKGRAESQTGITVRATA